MKSFSAIKKVSLLLAVLVCSNIVIAQCNEKNMRKALKAGLGEYIFETASSKPFTSFSDKKVVDAAFSVYAQENYRVLNLCEGFGEGVEFIVYDADKKQLFSNGKDAGKKSFDFTAEKSGDYIIRFKFPEGANTAACVAFAVGYK